MQGAASAAVARGGDSDGRREGGMALEFSLVDTWDDGPRIHVSGLVTVWMDGFDGWPGGVRLRVLSRRDDERGGSEDFSAGSGGGKLLKRWPRVHGV